MAWKSSFTEFRDKESKHFAMSRKAPAKNRELLWKLEIVVEISFAVPAAPRKAGHRQVEKETNWSK